jgi:two-component system NtrC family sensor kinase
MLATVILGISIVLQCTAAGLALRLIRITGRWSAWVLIAVGILLMAVRRSLTMYHSMFGDAPVPPDLATECVALVSSAIMMVGVVSISPLFLFIKQSEEALERWAKTLEQKVEERTRELVESQAQAARQQRLASVGRLAAGVAHEINNPLGGILTFASLVQEALPPESPQREDVKVIIEQAVRCRNIVTELLEFSRHREAQMEPANINELILRTLALLEKQPRLQKINILRKLDARVPAIVMDEPQMQQVLVNVILNAVDAMPSGGDLTVETGLDGQEKHVFVRIIDTGCGIPPEHREAIFDPFFTTKPPGEGTGLGLAIVHRIVQAHGGHTEVESEVGKGTCFTVFLPIGDKVAVASGAGKESGK